MCVNYTTPLPVTLLIKSAAKRFLYKHCRVVCTLKNPILDSDLN